MVKPGWRNNMKKILLIICFLFSGVLASVLDECYKIYPVDADNLFMSSLNVLGNNSKFDIAEIQTKNGYIIFTALKNKYLATVAGIDNNNSILKITPCNDIYFFQASILSNIFKYIEANKGN